MLSCPSSLWVWSNLSLAGSGCHSTISSSAHSSSASLLPRTIFSSESALHISGQRRSQHYSSKEYSGSSFFRIISLISLLSMGLQISLQKNSSKASPLLNTLFMVQSSHRMIIENQKSFNYRDLVVKEEARYTAFILRIFPRESIFNFIAAKGYQHSVGIFA